MALKIRGAAAPTPPKDTHFELATAKDGTLFLRGVTHDGKKFRLVDITAAGLKLRSRNTHADLGVAVDRNGALKVS